MDVSSEDSTVILENLDPLKIKVDEIKKFDLNKDDVYDLSIALLSTSGGTGQFSLTEISEEIPKPNIEDIETVLKCGNLKIVKERVKCRLTIQDYELAQEQELQYLPEECRALTDKKECINRYKLTQRCWKFPVGDKRIDCVKENLKLGDIKNDTHST